MKGFRHASFVAQVHLDPALEPSEMTGDETFVFGLHPHGVLSEYRILLDGVTAEHFPKVGGGCDGVQRSLACRVRNRFLGR